MASVRNMPFVLIPWVLQNTFIGDEVKTLSCSILYVKSVLTFYLLFDLLLEKNTINQYLEYVIGL